MIFRDSKGRACEIVETEMCDDSVTVLSATYLDDTHAEAEEVSEQELDHLQSHYQDYLLQRAQEDRMARAYDYAKDRRQYGDD